MRALILVCAVVLAGCNPTVGSVCADLEDASCADPECERTGDGTQNEAERKGCGSLFDRYLDCVDQASCDYGVRCFEERYELEACAGPFQPRQ